MGYQFIIDMLKEKKQHMLTALQYIEAGCDNPKTIKVVINEIKELDKRIKGLEESV